MLRHVERFLNCSSILCPNKQTKSHRQLNVKGMAPTCNICNTKQKLYNFTTTALKAHLSTQSSSLSVFMVRKAHISAQKPHGRHLNTRGALCSQHFEYGSNYGHVFPTGLHALFCVTPTDFYARYTLRVRK